MRQDEVAQFFAYLYWARDRILLAAGELSHEEFRSLETVTTRDLRATLAHQVENEWAWRVRLSAGTFPPGDVLPADFATLDSLAARWRREEVALRSWLGRLSDGDLATCPPGEDDGLAPWQCLMYVVTHGIQQLTEAAVLLTRLGHSPGEIGYLTFCAEVALNPSRR